MKIPGRSSQPSSQLDSQKSTNSQLGNIPIVNLRQAFVAPRTTSTQIQKSFTKHKPEAPTKPMSSMFSTPKHTVFNLDAYEAAKGSNVGHDK